MRLTVLGLVLATVPAFGEVRPLEVAGAPFPLEVAEWTPPARDFPITAYGAKSDGTAVTEAIEGAIAAAHAAGGGRVVVPAGEWTTGAFRLQSEVALVLEKEAVLHFPDDPTIVMRAPLKSDGLPTMTHWALIGAVGCTNVAIMGGGTIRCDVDYWHRNFLLDPRKGFPRPHLTTFKNCRNVRLENFRVRGSPCWTLVLDVCEDIVIRGVDSSSTGPNVDGIDLSSCNRALVENCSLDQTDDCYTIKSGANERGRARGIPSQNIVIRNCRAVHGHTLLGVGSEVSGGIRNVYLADCTVEEDCWRYLFVKTNAKRGGFVENVTIENVCGKRASQSVLEIDMFYDGNPNKELTETSDRRWVTRIENISAKNVRCGRTKCAVKVIGDRELPPRGIVADSVCVGKVERQLTSLHRAPDVTLTDVKEETSIDWRGGVREEETRFPIEWNEAFPTAVPYELVVSTGKFARLAGVPSGSGFAIRSRTANGEKVLPVTALRGRTDDAVVLRFRVPEGTVGLSGTAGVGRLALVEATAVDNLFASFAPREAATGWSQTVAVPDGLAGQPVAFEATVENLGELPQNAELRLYQVDARGETLPETVVDRRWTGHMHPARGKVRYRERGRLHPAAKSVRLWFGIGKSEAKFDLAGLPRQDARPEPARFRVSGVALRPAVELPFPAYDERNFRSGVTGRSSDRSIALGGYDERAFWFQTRSSASWAGGTQLRREEQVFYPAGAGSVEAWFKSNWTPAPIRGKRGAVIRNRPIALFQCYQSFLAKEYKAGKGAVMEVAYLPEKGELALSMLKSDGKPCSATASVTLPSDVWFHLAVEWTPRKTAAVYVDGKCRLTLAIPDVVEQDLADKSVRFPNDACGHEFYLGSSWQSARAKAMSDPDRPLFQGAADLLRISSGLRYGGEFVPTKSYGCDGRTRAYFAFDKSFDGGSGGGVGWIRGTTRSLGCGRVAHRMEMGGKTVQYYPDRLPSENDPGKVFSIDNYPNLPTTDDFMALRRPFRLTRSMTGGATAEVDWPKGAVQDYVEIENKGPAPLRFPIVLNEGEADPRSYSDLAASLKLAELPPRERVNKLFAYVLGASDYFIQHTAMFARGSDVPETVQYRAMLMLNGYCGFECGPLNNLAANLFVSAGGCPATQTAGYAHEFEQVFYDGKNHIYDLSAQKFFPAMDNETAAYLEEGGDEAGIFPRMGNAADHFIRKSTRDFWINPPDLPEKVGVTLNPGERFRVWQVNDGRCNDLMTQSRTGVYRGYPSPFRPEYGEECHADVSKRFLQRVERFFPHYLNGFLVFDGRPTRDNPAFVTEEDSFCYRVDAGGYPIVAADYRATTAAGELVELEISTDNGKSFRALISPATYSVRARYGYLVRIKAPIESVTRFEASTEVQLNPRIYTGCLRAGKNRVTFKSVSGGPAKVTWQGRTPAGTLRIPAAVSSGAIPGIETLFYAFDSKSPATLSIEGLSPSLQRGLSPAPKGGQSPDVVIRATGVNARYCDGKLHLEDISSGRPHFAFVTFSYKGAEKTLTLLTGKGVRFVSTGGVELPPSRGCDLRFEKLPEGRYAILNLNRFPSHPGEVFGASLFLCWPGYREFGCGYARNPACNFKKADFGKMGGWANTKWDYSLHPETTYPFLNLRVSKLPAADHLTIENRSQMTIGLGAVLIVPDPDIDLRAELIQYLCGLNSDPARIRNQSPLLGSEQNETVQKLF